MSLFNFNKADPAPAATPTPASNAAPEADPTSNPAAPAPELQGLDRLQNLLDNDPTDGKPDDTISPESDEPFNPVELLNNPEMLDKLSSSLDFSSAISPETQTKLANNEPDGLLSLVQDAGKMAYQQALKHSSVLMQQTLDDRLSRLDKSTQDAINNSLGKHELHRELPELNNPLISMAVEGFQAKLKQQNPSFSTEQVAVETRNYVKSLANEFDPNRGKPSTDNKPEAIDWFEELGLG